MKIIIETNWYEKYEITEIRYDNCDSTIVTYKNCNELSLFFKKYPNELYNKVLMSRNGQTNITEEDIKFYKSEVE